MQFQKKSYTAPKLNTHGDIEVLTQGTKLGELTDKTFPVNTPRGKLTFS